MQRNMKGLKRSCVECWAKALLRRLAENPLPKGNGNENNMRSLPIIALSLLIAGQCLAQSPAEAVKVAEYNDTKSDFKALSEKTHAFLDKLAEHPRAGKGVVIVYPQLRVQCSTFKDMWSEDDEIYAFILRIVKLRTDISTDGIVVIRGNSDIRPSSAEFWIVPDGAETPQPRMIEFDPGHCCPTITLAGPSKVSRSGGKVSFFVYLRPSSFGKELSHEWKVSGGTIVSGQESDEIVVDVSKLKTSSLIVSVEFTGNPSFSCPTTASMTVSVLK